MRSQGTRHWPGGVLMERECVPFSLKAPGPWETPRREAVGPFYPYREERWERVHVGVPEGWEGERWPHGTQTTSIVAAGPELGVPSRMKRREKVRRGWWVRGQAPSVDAAGCSCWSHQVLPPLCIPQGSSAPLGRVLGLFHMSLEYLVGVWGEAESKASHSIGVVGPLWVSPCFT